MDPMTMMLIGQGLNAGTKLLFPEKSGLIDPSKYKNQLTYSNQDINSMYGNTMQDIGRRSMAGLNLGMSRINQAGAAGRLPSGAVMSNIAGAQYNNARGISEGASQLRPNLTSMQRQAMQNYYNLMNQYSTGQAEFRNKQIQGFRGDIGNMTKMGMLWKAGYFDGGGEPSMPQVPMEEPNTQEMLLPGMYQTFGQIPFNQRMG